MLLASAVPVIVGVASLVLPPSATGPLTGSVLSVTDTMAGASGAAASILVVTGPLALPAASVAVMPITVPSASAGAGV